MGPSISIFSTSLENCFAAVKDPAAVIGSPISFVACVKGQLAVTPCLVNEANIVQNNDKGFLGKVCEGSSELPKFLLVHIRGIWCRDYCNCYGVFKSKSGAAEGDLCCKTCAQLTGNRERKLCESFEQRAFTRALISNYNQLDIELVSISRSPSQAYHTCGSEIFSPTPCSRSLSMILNCFKRSAVPS